MSFFTGLFTKPETTRTLGLSGNHYVAFIHDCNDAATRWGIPTTHSECVRDIAIQHVDNTDPRNNNKRWACIIGDMQGRGILPRTKKPTIPHQYAQYIQEVWFAYQRQCNRVDVANR